MGMSEVEMDDDRETHNFGNDEEGSESNMADAKFDCKREKLPCVAFMGYQGIGESGTGAERNACQKGTDNKNYVTYGVEGRSPCESCTKDQSPCNYMPEENHGENVQLAQNYVKPECRSTGENSKEDQSPCKNMPKSNPSENVQLVVDFPVNEVDQNYVKFGVECQSQGETRTADRSPCKNMPEQNHSENVQPDAELPVNEVNQSYVKFGVEFQSPGENSMDNQSPCKNMPKQNPCENMQPDVELHVNEVNKDYVKFGAECRSPGENGMEDQSPCKITPERNPSENVQLAVELPVNEVNQKKTNVSSDELKGTENITIDGLEDNNVATASDVGLREIPKSENEDDTHDTCGTNEDEIAKPNSHTTSQHEAVTPNFLVKCLAGKAQASFRGIASSNCLRDTKALIECERHTCQCSELILPVSSLPNPSKVKNEAYGHQVTCSVHPIHVQRLFGYGEDQNNNILRSEKIDSIGSVKHMRPSKVEHALKAARIQTFKQDQLAGDGGNGYHELTSQETEDIEVIGDDGVSRYLLDGSIVDAGDGQNLDANNPTSSFCFLVRMPRYDGEFREQIKNATLQVDEKTQYRDAIRVEIQKIKAKCQGHGFDYEAAKSEERAVRRLIKSKRQEIDSVQSMINRVKNAISVDDIDARIYNMEYMIAHETIPLKEEKQFIREIKQLKHLREQLSSNMGSQDEVQQALDQRDQIEGRLKILKKELDCLKDKVSKAETAALEAGKKYDEENRKLIDLQTQVKAADDIRQDAYAHLFGLKRQLFEKNVHFRTYKEDSIAAHDYAFRRDMEALRRLCLNQVERVMELRKTSDDFEKEYVRCNTRSTLRRFGTLDGRLLGPDEVPPVLPNFVDERAVRSISSTGKADTMSQILTLEQEKEVSGVESETSDGKSTTSVAEQKIQVLKSKTPGKPVMNGIATVSSGDKTTEADIRWHTEEEHEMAIKEEELRKQEAETKLREQRRLEEKAKAMEAIERKKRNAEKAQIRAELWAQKEAELKEKEREKRLRKKGKKKATAPDASDGGNSDGEIVSTLGIASETIKEPESKESAPATIAKKPVKPSQFTKHNKTKSIPPSLRNRSKKRVQQWMWMILTTLLIVALFFLGNIGFFTNPGLRRHGF